MKKFTLVLLAALPLCAVAPAHAQTLQPGKWTGTVTPPGEQQSIPVTFQVTVSGDTTRITVDAGEHGSYPFSDVKLSDQTLTFWFMPGPRVDCALRLGEDGVLQGPCHDTEGGIASMSMVPPRKE